MTKHFKPHPAAALMPLMDAAQLKELTEDIRKNGQTAHAVLHDGLLLDGRNRQEACRALGVELKTEEWNGKGGSPATFVVSANVVRRHLKPAQKAVIGVKLLPIFRAEAKQRQIDAAKKPRQKGATARTPKRKATVEVARAVEVGSRSIEQAAAIAKTHPKLFAALGAGEITINQAAKQVRIAARVAEATAYVVPVGRYAVIVADPPWRFDDELNGSMNRGLEYPTMTVEEISALQVPAATDCILWLWTTKSHLLDGSAQRVLKAWGFEPRSMVTWVKSNLGLGRWLRNRCEFCILAIKGSPTVDLHSQEDVLLQTGKRLAHSEKPAEFFALVESLCPSPSRIELFARKPRAGWVTSGSELAVDVATAEARPAVVGGEQVEPPRPVEPSFSHAVDHGTSEGRFLDLQVGLLANSTPRQLVEAARAGGVNFEAGDVRTDEERMRDRLNDAVAALPDPPDPPSDDIPF